MVALVIDEDLRLVRQASKSRGMDNPVAVPPESIAAWTGWLDVAPAPALRRIGRINCSFTPGFDRHSAALTSLARALNYPLGHLPIG